MLITCIMLLHYQLSLFLTVFTVCCLHSLSGVQYCECNKLLRKCITEVNNLSLIFARILEHELIRLVFNWLLISCNSTQLQYINAIAPLSCLTNNSSTSSPSSDNTYRYNNTDDVVESKCLPYPSAGACGNILTSDYQFFARAPASTMSSYYTSAPFQTGELIASSLEFMYALIPRNFQQCPMLLQKYVCSSMFPRCSAEKFVMNQTSYTVAVPQRLCASTCSSYLSECIGFLSLAATLLSSSTSPAVSQLTQLVSLLLPNCQNGANLDSCTLLQNNPLAPTFSNIQDTYQIGAINMTVPCNSFQSSYNQSIALVATGAPPIKCPAPLFVSDYLEQTVPPNAYCTIPCPFPDSSKDSRIMLGTYNFVLTILSLICTTFMLLV